MKTIEQHFADWEADVFGYGYGTGEAHTLRALKAFLAEVPADGGYDYRLLELALTPSVSWLLINTLCAADVIEYGTSPRGGWLTENGKALAEFVGKYSVEQLATFTDHGNDYVHCYPDHCNCTDGDCRPGNPFWSKDITG